MIDRYKVLTILWFLTIAWCCFFSSSTYINLIVIVFGFFGMILGFGYVEKNMNKKELRTFKKLHELI